MSANFKKRKGMTDEEVGKMSLKDVCEFILSGIIIHQSVQAWSKSVKNNDQQAFRILSSQFLGDAFSVNTHCIHPHLERFSIKRNEYGVVTSISHDKIGLKGKALHKIMVATYAILNNIREIILEEHDDFYEVLLLPPYVNVVKLNDSKKKEFHESAVEIHTFKAKVNVFFSTVIMKDIAKMPYIKTNNVKSVLTNLNNLFEKDNFNLELSAIDELPKVQKLLNASERRLHANFYTSLIGAMVESSSIDEKIKAFVQAPSVTFCRTLNLKKPYSAPLVHSGSLDTVEKVALDTLDDDDLVVLSTINIDQKFYESIQSKPEKFLVYVSTANIGFKKGKKFQELTMKSEISAKDLKSLLTAIASDNKNMKSHVAGSESESEDSEGMEVLEL